MRRVFLVAALAASAAGCAKDASSVGATYISPVTYDTYTCPQLAEEIARVSIRAAQATGVQNQKATNDAVGMTVGLVVFWPALFLIKGNDENTAELSRLKGNMEAIEQASIKKRCGIQFKRGPLIPEPTQEELAPRGGA